MAQQGTADIEIYRGDYFEYPMQFHNNTGTVEEPVLVPIDLTGHVFSSQIRDSPDGTVLAEFEFIDVDLTNGEVTAFLTDVKTAALSPGSAVWDVQSVFDTKTRTWLKGTVTIEADVTRAEGGG